MASIFQRAVLSRGCITFRPVRNYLKNLSSATLSSPQRERTPSSGRIGVIPGSKYRLSNTVRYDRRSSVRALCISTLPGFAGREACIGSARPGQHGSFGCRVGDVTSSPWRRKVPALQASEISKETELEFAVDVNIEEGLEGDATLEGLAEQLRVDGALAVKLAMEGFEELDKAESVELSVMLCSDPFIQSLNATWRNEDAPTDVLSFGQEQEGLTPVMMLGDVIISAETAGRQAVERGHTLLDETRILLVHGLLHVLGFDHEEGEEAAADMAEEEQRILAALGWGGKGLIEAAKTPPPGEPGSSAGAETANGGASAEVLTAQHGAKAAGRPPAGRSARKAPFKYLFCDMDGTLLNSSSRISPATAQALRAASNHGVTIVIATGKARPAAMSALDAVGLAGSSGIITLDSPGVFLQGLRVYGHSGSVVHNLLLPPEIAAKGFRFAEEHDVALIGFSGDRCVTLIDKPLVEALHTQYYEPRAAVMPNLAHLLEHTPIQKLLFYDTEEMVKDFIRPHWSAMVSGKATVTQAVAGMLEILPPGASKGAGVQILLDHLGVGADEVMAIGDGENDLELLAMAGWGVAMANGAAATLAVADATVGSNDHDGVAEAIERFILST